MVLKETDNFCFQIPTIASLELDEVKENIEIWEISHWLCYKAGVSHRISSPAFMTIKVPDEFAGAFFQLFRGFPPNIFSFFSG